MICAYCGQPVLPDHMVKVGGDPFHLECVWEAGRRFDFIAKHPHIIRRQSPISGKENEMVIWMTDAQFDELERPDRRRIQDVLPDASAEEREFLISGMSPQEQHEFFREQQ